MNADARLQKLGLTFRDGQCLIQRVPASATSFKLEHHPADKSANVPDPVGVLLYETTSQLRSRGNLPRSPARSLRRGSGSGTPDKTVKVADVKSCLTQKGLKTDHSGSFIPQNSGGYINAQFPKYNITIVLTGSSGESRHGCRTRWSSLPRGWAYPTTW